jgi:hypothetical protein
MFLGLFGRNPCIIIVATSVTSSISSVSSNFSHPTTSPCSNAMASRIALAMPIPALPAPKMTIRWSTSLVFVTNTAAWNAARVTAAVPLKVVPPPPCVRLAETRRRREALAHWMSSLKTLSADYHKGFLVGTEITTVELIFLLTLASVNVQKSLSIVSSEIFKVQKGVSKIK